MAEQPIPASFDTIFQREIRAINERRMQGPDAPAPDDLFGICFSGGGIRSATFNLGVLQGLAAHGLLRFADYLSTVSGGGYIGSWFQALCKREGLAEAEKLLTEPPPAGKDPISFLRTYSNYLAPQLGLLSTDTWLILLIWLRNTILNQVIFLLSLAAILLAPLCLGNLARLEYNDNAPWWGWLIFALIAIGVPLMAAVLRIDVNLPRATTRELRRSAENAPDSAGAVFGFIEMPVFIAAVMLAFEIGSNSFQPWKHSKTAIASSAILLFLYGLSVFRGRFLDCFRAKHDEKYASLGLILGIVIVVVCSAVTFSLLSGVAWILPRGNGIEMWHAIAWGPPLIIVALMSGVALQIGLMGDDFAESGREWYSRLGTKLMLLSAAWAIGFGITVFLPMIVIALFEHWKSIGMGAIAGWIVTTVAGFQTGKSARSLGTPPANASAPKPTKTAVEWISQIAPPIAAVGLLIAISTVSFTAIHSAWGAKIAETSIYSLSVTGFASLLPESWFGDPAMHTALLLNGAQNWMLAGTALALFVIALLMSLRVNINLFSMNYFYKNRLVRCYLGASNASRKPDRFTGFDPNDDILLRDLAPSQTHDAPLAIVNCTLNLNHGDQLAWQERKAESFIFTPLYCGYIPESGRAGYFPTEYLTSPEGPHLGLATAISGAAANPNWGFHTSPVTAFLMTLFNVRLGWWIGNTVRPETAQRFGPHVALWYLFKELLALTDEKTGYLNLSDGGHFENLGLYELLRRRCKFIIVSDGEQDEQYVFESLGGAIRKARVDFGYNIEISPRNIRLKDGASAVHCAVGIADYGQGETGTLLYIKASLTGDEPWDVEQYKLSHGTFPQETTADQFFSESQFESYRALGCHAVEKVLAGITKTRTREDLSSVVEQVRSKRTA